MSKPWVIEMRSGALVEWLRQDPDNSHRLKWTLNINKAVQWRSEAAAWKVIEHSGYAGKDNVRPRKLS